MTFIAAGLCACTVGPDYKRPDTPISNLISYIAADKASEPASHDQEQEWWRRYEDPLLNRLIEDLLKQNYDLKAAAERMIQARERMAIQTGRLLPSLSVDGTSTRQAVPTTENNSSRSIPNVTAQIPQSDTNFRTSYDLGLSASWQIDLFGKIRRERAAAEASYLAASADRQALVQSLIIQLIRQRIQIANLQAQFDLTQQTIRSRQTTLETLQRRYNMGSTSVRALELRLARENLASAKANLSTIRADLKDALYALALLVGNLPQENAEVLNVDFPLLPPPERLKLPPPMALLDRRPDIRRSEYRLIAASENIGAAVGELYPSLSISGGYGYQATGLENLISADQIAWNLISNLTAPLFEGGRLRADLRLQESRARELAANYAQTILTSMRDVESALQREEQFRSRLAQLKITEQEAAMAHKLAINRYEQGILDLTRVLDIERRLFATRLQILSVKNAVWQARLDLMLALGGDWTGNQHQPKETRINGVAVSNLKEDAVRLTFHEAGL